MIGHDLAGCGGGPGRKGLKHCLVIEDRSFSCGLLKIADVSDPPQPAGTASMRVDQVLIARGCHNVVVNALIQLEIRRLVTLVVGLDHVLMRSGQGFQHLVAAALTGKLAGKSLELSEKLDKVSGVLGGDLGDIASLVRKDVDQALERQDLERF